MFILILIIYLVIKKIFFKNVFFISNKKNIPIELIFKNLKKFFNFNINNLKINQKKYSNLLILIDINYNSLKDDFFIKKKYFYKFIKNYNKWKLKSIFNKNIFNYKIGDCSSIGRA